MQMKSRMKSRRTASSFHGFGDSTGVNVRGSCKVTRLQGLQGLHGYKLHGCIGYKGVARVGLVRRTPPPPLPYPASALWFREMNRAIVVSLAVAVLLGCSGQKIQSKGIVTTKAEVAGHSHTNRLAREKSSYLLKHQNNPVEWYSESE